MTTAKEDAGEPRMAAAPPIKEAVFAKDSLRETATALLSLTENAPTELLAGANAAREHTKRRATMIDEFCCMLLTITESLNLRVVN